MVGEPVLSTGQTAKRLGTSVRAVYGRDAVGRLRPMTRLAAGQRRFAARQVDALFRCRTVGGERCAAYVRVSSNRQAEAGDPQRHRERRMARAAAKGDEAAVVVAERASGLNDKWRGLWRPFRLGASGEMDVVRTAFHDRLARTGFACVVQALGSHGVRVEVLDGPIATDATQERVADRLAGVTRGKRPDRVVRQRLSSVAAAARCARRPLGGPGCAVAVADAKGAVGGVSGKPVGGSNRPPETLEGRRAQPSGFCDGRGPCIGSPVRVGVPACATAAA